MRTFERNSYLCLSVIPVSDVTSTLIAQRLYFGFGREMNNFALFFLCQPVKTYLHFAWRKVKFLIHNVEAEIFDLLYVNYRTNVPKSPLLALFFLFLNSSAFCSTNNDRSFVVTTTNYPSSIHVLGHPTSTAGNALIANGHKKINSMKQVKITGYTLEPDGYYVYLGNSHRQKFSSEKKAKRFIAVTNQFLTQKLYQLRNIYIETWVKYQNSWGYFDHNKPSMNSGLYQMERGCEECLRTCGDRFNIIIERADWTNGNHFAFKNLSTVCNNLKDAVLILNRITRSRSITGELYAYDDLFSRICTLENDIKEYGKPGAMWLFKTAMHIREPEKINVPKPAYT